MPAVKGQSSQSFSGKRWIVAPHALPLPTTHKNTTNHQYKSNWCYAYVKSYSINQSINHINCIWHGSFAPTLHTCSFSFIYTVFYQINAPAWINPPGTFRRNISLKIGNNWSKINKNTWKPLEYSPGPLNTPGCLSMRWECLFGEIRYGYLGQVFMPLIQKHQYRTQKDAAICVLISTGMPVMYCGCQLILCPISDVQISNQPTLRKPLSPPNFSRDWGLKLNSVICSPEENFARARFS